jgi:tyrosine-protein kinase Etk/Wzc
VGEIDTRANELGTNIAAAGRELQNIPLRTIREEQLMRQRELDAELYSFLRGRYQQAELAAKTTAVPDMQVMDTASVPFTPVTDPRPTVILMCVMGGLGLALVGAFLRDRMDPRLRYPDEVTAGMGLNILGAVPALRRGRLGTSDMALAVEAFRAIQFNIVHAHGAAGPVMVTFTSPGASDGKSFVASNLAIAFADMGYRTLLIDGDVRRGTLHRLLDTGSRPGLTDYLAGDVSRASVVYSTRYPALELIPCGTRTSAGPKLLGGPPMVELMAELKPHYDVILVDSPPLGACVDPMILATLTQNLALVLRTGTTDRSLAESKLDLLDRLPVRVLGAILNDVSSSGSYRYYSYMSGYEAYDEIPNGDGPKELEPAQQTSGD